MTESSSPSDTSAGEPGDDTESGRPVLDPGVRWERYQRYPYLLAKLVFFGLLFAGVVWVLVELSAIVFPIFVALLLAYLLNPAVRQLEQRGIQRPFGITIIVTSLLLFVVLFAWVLYPTMAEQVRRIGERAPQAWQFLEQEFFPWITETFGLEFPETVEEAFEQYGQEIREAVPTVAERIGEWTGEIITRTQVVLVSLFNIVMVPIFTVYFLKDLERGKDKLRQIVPRARRELILDRLRKMDVAVGQWFRGQIQVSLILAVLYAIGLGLVYGLTGHDAQSGVVIGLLTGFLNVVPYLGFAVGSLLAFLVVLIEWTGWAALIGVAVAFTVIQLAESYYITPRVMGERVGMNPAAVIIVLLIGGSVAGILGVVLAIPIAGAVKVLFPDVIAWYRSSSIYTGVPVVPAGSVSSDNEEIDDETDSASGRSGPVTRVYSEQSSEDDDDDAAPQQQSSTDDGDDDSDATPESEDPSDNPPETDG